MSTMTRRNFFTTTTLAVGATALSGRSAAIQPPAGVAPVRAKSGVDLVTLGKTGTLALIEEAVAV